MKAPTKVDVAIALSTERVEMPDPTSPDDFLFTSRQITKREFIDARVDGRIPDAPFSPGNTAEAMAILGLHSRQSVYKLDLPYQLVDGQRHYDLDAVRAHAAANALKSDHARLAEAAAIVGVTSQTLARWTRDGRITAVEINGARAYRRGDLAALGAKP